MKRKTPVQLPWATRQIVWIAALAVWLLPGYAGEAVRFSDAPDPVPSRSGTEQKVRTAKDNDLRGIRSRTAPERGVTMPNVPLPPPSIAAPPLTERERVEMERKQNWIFQTPDSRGSGRDGVEDAFGVESQRLEKDWGMDRGQSDSLTRFIEREPLVGDEDQEARRQHSASSDEDDRDRDAGNDRRRRTSGQNSQSRELGGPDQGFDSQRDSRERMTDDAFRPQDDSRRLGFDGSDRMNLRPRFGSEPSAESARSESPFRLNGPARITARDFGLPSGSVAATSKDVGGNDPVNLFPDLTKQAVNPVTVGAAPQNSPARPSDAFSSGFTRSPVAVRPRFGESVGSSFGAGPASRSIIESRPTSGSKLFSNPVAIEMPKRGF